MVNIPSDLQAEGTTFVTTDGIGARQVESYLARQHLAEGRTAWSGPAVMSYRAWTNRLWSRYLEDGSRQLLTSAQTRGLWRRIIEDSSVAQQLLGARNAESWAMQALQRLRDWRVDVTALRASDDDIDFRCFLEWAKAYRRALTDSGWLDPGETEAVLRNRVEAVALQRGESTLWTELDPTPARDALAAQLEKQGHAVRPWRAPETGTHCRRVQLPEPTDEVEAAGRWAAGKLAQDPQQRIAIVVPGLATGRTEVRRTLEEAVFPDQRHLGARYTHELLDIGGEAPLDEPLIGAALTGLALFSGRGRFATFSRWLRSPFFVTEPPDGAARCLLEADLRVRVEAQLGFLEAYRSGGMGARVRTQLPALADTFSAVLSITDAEPGQATPTHWVGVWRRTLSRLAWHGSTTHALGAEAWETALNELALLTPILGAIPAAAALTELEGILAQPQRVGPTPLSGVFVLARPEDVGPGYDALWVSGLTDSRWPCLPQPNPLLPRELQRAHEMPLISPADALEHSQQITRRLVGRAPEVVFSWPRLLHEYPTRPSPLIVSYPQIGEPELAGGSGRRAGRERFQSRPRTSHADSGPPVTERRLRGGARTLSLQATCPLRAFLESRLHARPLEPVRRGLSARQRGIATHRAMELLLQHLPTQSDLAAWTPSDRDARILAAVDRALRELFGRARGPLRILFDFETRRLHPVLGELLAIDHGRAPFQVGSVEERLAVPVGNFELNCRIDRVDELDGPDRALAIIDYKTGAAGTPADWLKDRPRDLQLPLYTLALGGAVSAAVIAVLRPQGVQYRGFWPEKGTFPGRPTSLPKGRTWPLQLDLWRAQIECLAEEFANGDTRLFEGELNEAKGSLAPLTRVYEQVALDRGWLEPWPTE